MSAIVTYFSKNAKSTFEHNSTQKIRSKYKLHANMVAIKNQEIKKGKVFPLQARCGPEGG